jgi:anaerobic selenocysteine-containing dehydrogenase
MPCQTRTTADRAASRPRAEGGELYSASFAKAGYAPLPEYVEPIDSPVSKPGSDYPLVLAAFRSINYCDQQHRKIPRLRRGVPDPIVVINPETAAKLNIVDGGWAIVETSLGRIKLKASYNNSLHPSVVAATYRWWQGCRELVSVPHRSLMCRVSLVRLNREP